VLALKKIDKGVMTRLSSAIPDRHQRYFFTKLYSLINLIMVTIIHGSVMPLDTVMSQGKNYLQKKLCRWELNNKKCFIYWWVIQANLSFSHASVNAVLKGRNQCEKNKLRMRLTLSLWHLQESKEADLGITIFICDTFLNFPSSCDISSAKWVSKKVSNQSLKIYKTSSDTLSHTPPHTHF